MALTIIGQILLIAFLSNILFFANGITRYNFNARHPIGNESGLPSNNKILAVNYASSINIPASEITHHPLDPLTSSEIRLAIYLIKALNGTREWIFKSISLKEPEKATLTESFLNDDDLSVVAAGIVDRSVRAVIQDPVSYEAYEVVVSLMRLTSLSWKEVPEGSKPPMITHEDILLAEKIAFANPEVSKRIQSCGFNLSTVIADVWEAGYVADNPSYATSKIILQMFLYGSQFKGDNFYAHPLDFVIYVDTQAETVRGIENLPIQSNFDRDNRKGNDVPTTSGNYFSSNQSDGLNPIKITQPSGPTFSLHGWKLSWQNFVMRIGYNAREGVVLHHVKYNDNGKFRPLLYRISLSEIFATYGDPRPPFHRKKSFDMGEFRIGMSSSELPVDRFCPGEARYRNMIYTNEAGEIFSINNAICIVEEDAGVLWAHYDWTRGKTAMMRSQRLSISFLATVCHSDYWISWRFYEDATIELSIRLTGLLNTISNGSRLRIDADIDGLENSVALEDVVAVEGDFGSSTNPYGNGITTRQSLLKTVNESTTKVSPNTGRTWKLFNPNKLDPLSKTPVSWKLVPKGDFVPLLLKRDSPLRKNTKWTDYNMWVLPHNDDQIYASGQWMNSDGLSDWTTSNDKISILNKDLVLWHIFGLTNIPVSEKWPVNSDPQGSTGFILKPSQFFNRNMALNPV